MNIALGHDAVLPGRGEEAAYVIDLARRLVADRHEVHLYASRRDAAALPDSLRCHDLPAARGPRWLRARCFARSCRAALDEARHDVTVGFAPIAGLDVLYPLGGLYLAAAEQHRRAHAGRLARRLAAWARHFDPAHWSFTALERRAYLGPFRTQIVVSSQMVRHHFADRLKISPDRIAVIPAAIDSGRFPQHDRLRRRQEARQRWGLAPQEIVGLFAAADARRHGLGPLLGAVATLLQRPEFRNAPPPLRLLVGGGDHGGRYAGTAARLGVAPLVRFAGPCPDRRDAYFASDFLVHPTFHDPCAAVVLEALACDLPVITSRGNGAGELMHPLQEGYVIDDPHDHAHLAWCLAQMLDPARRRACAQAARRAAAQWTFEHHYRQMIEVLQEAAAAKRAA